MTSSMPTSTPSSAPLISVIIPAYNQGHYIAAAIQSVLDQSYENLELLVVDDGSTDDTRGIVAEFSDRRLRYIYQENQGLSAARNCGIRYSTGDFLSFLDSDDLFLPDKLQLLVDLMQTDPEIGLAAGQAIPFDELGEHPEKLYATPLPLDSAQLLLSNPLHVGSILLRRTWQQEVGLFDESLRSYEDWDMWLRLVRAGCPTGWIAQPVSYYRFHHAQMTSNSAQMSHAAFAVLDKVFASRSIPKHWKAMHNQAYASAYLRTAAQAYHVHDFAYGKHCILQAVSLYPTLLENDADLLVNRFHAWANSPKIAEPHRYLEEIYTHLPDNLAKLCRRWRQERARVAVQQALESYRRGDQATTRSVILRMLVSQSRWLWNRRSFSVCLRSCLQLFTPRWT
jgi:glycosyltransferase involved in cell wall biosynthesis